MRHLRRQPRGGARSGRVICGKGEAVPAVVQFRAGKALTVRSAADVFLGSLGTFSQAELTVDRVITRFITRSPRRPPLPSRACQVIRLWVPSWCYGPAVSHRRRERSGRATEGRQEGCPGQAR